MKQLIISNYDSATNFTWVVIENGIEVARGHESSELKRYTLYDEEWHWFDENLINFDTNELIQEFDMIIYCEDGTIQVHKNDKSEHKEEERPGQLSIFDFMEV